MMTRADRPGGVDESVVDGLLHILDELRAGVGGIEKHHGSRPGADNGAMHLAERMCDVFFEQLDEPSEVHCHWKLRLSG